MRINKHDTQGTKPLLAKGELGYDDYNAGGDAGRVYVGTGSENIPLAEKSEVDSHVNRVDNPHGVTKTQIGLGNVDNTADVNKNVLSATKWTTARTITLSGDVAGSVSMDGTDNVSITTTVQPNSVALGTDTTGNYVAGATAGTGITVSGTAGEGWSPTIAVDSTVATLTGTQTLTNKTLQDSTTFIVDNTDATKKVQFDVAGVTTATTRTMTVPNVNGTIVTTGDTGTVTSTMIADGTIVNADINASAAIVDTKLATISTTGKVANSATSAVTTNTANTIVLRDASGNFSAGTITANLSGNAQTATAFVQPITINITGDVGANDVLLDGTGNVTLSSALANSGVTAGNYAKVTVDSKGRVTAGLTPTMEDIPDATFKRSAKAATTANITLSAPQTIDGIALVAGDRVLVKDQTTTSQNGIYIVQSAAWTRALDADTSSKIASALIAVDSGTVNGGKLFDNDFKTTDTLGTTAMLWASNLDSGHLSSSIPIVAGTGSAGTAVTISRSDHVHPAQTTITGNAGTATALQTGRTIGMTGDVTYTSGSFNGSANVTGTATLATVTDSGTGTFKKITVDTKGRVTGTAAVAQSDITGLLGAGSITNTMLANSAVANLSGTNTGDETTATIKTKLGISTLSGSNTGDQTITLTGDVTGTGTGSFATTLASVGTAGTYTKVTTDAKGRITSGTTLSAGDVPSLDWSKITTGKPTTIAGYSISDAYTKTEVDGLLQGLKAKASVIVATTANITLSGTQTIDGVTVTAGQRVLVKNQTTASQNGIYVCSASAWSRSTDADTSTDIMSAYVFVEKGTANQDTAWVMNTDSVVLDTTSLTWVKFAGSGAYAATSHTHSAADITSGTLAVTRGGTGTTSSTGTGSVVLSTSPTLVTPNIGVASGTSFNSITGLSSTTPNMDGVASIGTSTTVARADHVHPAQTTISGNAGTATTLQTARTISIGNTGKTFDGSNDVSWTLNEIGAIGVDSPAFTGTPLTPTAAVGTNTTQIASTAFVKAEIANSAVAKVVSTDNAIVRFNGTTGEIKNSNITIDDLGNLGNGTQTFNGTASNATKLAGYSASTSGSANTIGLRDTSGDFYARLFRSTYAEQTGAPATTADICFRNDASSDNYMRFMSSDAFKAWLTSIGVATTDTNTWRGITDSVSTVDSTISASATAVKTAYDLALSANVSPVAGSGETRTTSSGSGNISSVVGGWEVFKPSASTIQARYWQHYTYRNCNCNCDCSCFVAGQPVLMADGSYKNIEDIKVGDKVQGAYGPNDINIVKYLQRPPRGNRVVYDVHGLLITDEHGVLNGNRDGFLYMDLENHYKESNMFQPCIDRGGKEVYVWFSGNRAGVTKKEILTVGKTVATSTGSREVTQILPTDRTDEQLYHLVLDGGSRTYCISDTFVSGYSDDKVFDYTKGVKR